MNKIACVVAGLLLTGCAARTSHAPTDLPPAEPPPPALSQPVQATSDAAEVLVRFANLVTAGEIQGAASLLAPNLRGVYEYKEYAPIRNTPRMEIGRLTEMTAIPSWNPDVGGRDQKTAHARVFALDIRYKVLGIIESEFTDGEIYHHKATVTKYTPDGPWLISELSGRPPAPAPPQHPIAREKAVEIATGVDPKATWEPRLDVDFHYEFNREERTRPAWVVQALSPAPNTTLWIDAETGEILMVRQSEAPAPTIGK